MSPAGKNLLLRVASALVLLPIVLALVWVGGLPLAALVALAAALAAYEMASMALRSARFPVKVLVVALAAFIPLGIELASPGLAAEAAMGFLVATIMLLWLVNLLLPGQELSEVPARVGLSLLTVLYVGALLAPLVLLRMQPAGVWWIVLALAVTFLNDTGAYFAGRAFGRAKLYPRVSPAKTWAGFAGGVVTGGLASMGVVALSQAVEFGSQAPLPMSLLSALGAGLLLSALASAGDLCESLLKRAFQVKDSGNLIPGHGGMLDRIDALLFSGPLLWLWSLFV